MRVAVVSGDEETRSSLIDFVEQYCKESGEKVRISQFSDGIDVVSDYTADFDVIFLDTVMKHLDWQKTAEYIRNMDKKVVLAFVTAEPHYAVYGYSVDATSCMLKPLVYATFAQEFARCVQKFESVQQRFMVLSSDNGMDRIELDKITYVESEGHKMIINTADKTYVVYDTMRSLEAKLPKEHFARCNNCYIVNLSHVKGVHGEYVVLDGKELKISRSRRKVFERSWLQFLS